MKKAIILLCLVSCSTFKPDRKIASVRCETIDQRQVCIGDQVYLFNGYVISDVSEESREWGLLNPVPVTVVDMQIKDKGQALEKIEILGAPVNGSTQFRGHIVPRTTGELAGMPQFSHDSPVTNTKGEREKIDYSYTYNWNDKFNYGVLLEGSLTPTPFSERQLKFRLIDGPFTRVFKLKTTGYFYLSKIDEAEAERKTQEVIAKEMSKLTSKKCEEDIPRSIVKIIDKKSQILDTTIDKVSRSSFYYEVSFVLEYKCTF